MIGEILNAVIEECKALFTDTGGTVILKTDFLPKNLPSYQMPLILLDLLDAPDSRQFLGGATSMDWNFALNSYNYAPDEYVDDPGPYSNLLLNVMDAIRQHFSIRNWLSTQMPAIEENYGFKFTLSGITAADALEGDGLVMGFRIVFDSMAIDDSTEWIQPSTSVLENVVEVGSTETNEEHVGYNQTLNATIIMANTQVTIPANTKVRVISMINKQGTPTVRIGTTAGDDDIYTDTVIDAFKETSPDLYCLDETILYFTCPNPGMVNVRLDIQRDFFNN